MRTSSFLKPKFWTQLAAMLCVAMAMSVLATSSFGDVYSISNLADFDTVKDDGGTPGDALVSDLGGGQFSFLDNSGSDKPEAYIDFTNTAFDGVCIEFNVEFNNAAFNTLVSDPEVLVRMGNPGVLPDSNNDTGWQLNFRHETDDSTNQFRAANGTSSTNSGLGTSTGFNNVAELTSYSFTVLANNAAVAQNYSILGGGTVAAGTSDLFIDGVFIGNYDLSDGVANTNYDPALGFGTFGFTGSGNSDLGTDVLFENIVVRTGADNHLLAAVPEPGSAALLLAGLGSLGLVRRRK